MADLKAYLKKQIAFHQQQLDVYQAALEAAIADERSTQRTSIAAPQIAKIAAKIVPPTKRNGEPDTVSKIDFVYNLIEKYGKKKGLTPAQIRKLSPPEYIENGSAKTYPYVMLWKLKKNDEIEVDQGRYFPRSK